MSRNLSTELTSSLIFLQKQADHDCLVKTLCKPEKTKEDAKTMFEKIKNFSFFQNFFAHYIKDTDMHSILSLCQAFTYEKFEQNNLIIRQRDPSNNKFYVILSGEVAVIIKNDMLGQFGDMDADKKKTPEMPTTSSLTSVNGENSHERRKKKHLTILTKSDVAIPGMRNSKRYNSLVGTPVKKGANNSALLRAPHPKSIFSVRPSKDMEQVELPMNGIHGEGSNHNTLKLTETVETEMLPDLDFIPRTISEVKVRNSSIFGRKTKMIAEMVAGEKPVRTGTNTIRHMTLHNNSPSLNSPASLYSPSLQSLDVGEGPETERSQSVKIEEEEKSEFEKLALGFGKIIRYMKEGEGFGEIALKRNIPRTATILCKTDCEVLVMNKEQYELGFGRMQWEKEEFLNSVFTFLTTNIASSQNYNYLLYSFKTERYSRGAYLINEGTCNDKDPKFYIIQHGECSVEKQLAKEIIDPYDFQKTLVRSIDKVQITVAGRGVIAGEELLFNEQEYDYSLKVTSEMVMVQAITKRDFEQKFPKEFKEYVKNVYEKKKQHRELILEQIKKEHDLKITQYKNENVYCLKNVGIKDYVNKSSIQGFSKYINRNKLCEEKDPVLADLRTPNKTKPDSITLDGTITQGDEYNGQIHLRNSVREDIDNEKEDKEIMVRFTGVDDKKNNKIKAKMHFLNHISDHVINNKLNIEKELDDSESLFAMAKSKSQVEHRRIFSAKPSSKNKSHGFDNGKSVDPVEIILSKFHNKDKVQQTISSQKLDTEGPKSARFTERKAPTDSLKALYSQRLVKGPTFLTSPNNALSVFGMRPSSACSTKESPLQKRVSSAKISLFTSTAPTERPGSAKTREWPSSYINGKSPKLDTEGAENMSTGLLSINSLTVLPMSAENKELQRLLTTPKTNKHIIFFGENKGRKENKGTLVPNTSMKALKSLGVKKMSMSDIHLHEVKEWRRKIFKKPPRQLSASCIPTDLQLRRDGK